MRTVPRPCACGKGEQADVKAFVEGAVGHVSKNEVLHS